jgi:hypothetical protein
MKALSSYSVLGLRYGADEEEIRQAYRMLVKKYHPDLTRDPSSSEKLQKIISAYKDLSIKDRKNIIEVSVRENTARAAGRPSGIDEVLRLGRKFSLSLLQRDKLDIISKLGASGQKAAYIYLKNAMTDDDEVIVKAAVRASAQLKVLQSAGDFIKLFHKGNSEIKKTVLDAVEAIGDFQNFSSLIMKGIEDRDFMVKSRAFNIYLKYKSSFKN